jgi:hypothetical protein
MGNTGDLVGGLRTIVLGYSGSGSGEEVDFSQARSNHIGGFQSGPTEIHIAS